MINNIYIIFEKILENVVENIVDASNSNIVTNKDTSIDENTIIGKEIDISWSNTTKDTIASLKTFNFDFFA